MSEWGFTGTSDGMTTAQLATVDCLFVRHLVTKAVSGLHHGDCEGADAQADELARAHGIWRIAHPPENPRARAFCKCEEIRPAKPYLKRNWDVALEGKHGLIATPKTYHEMARGHGEWATIRYARKIGRRIYIVWPDGSVRKEDTHAVAQKDRTGHR